MEQVVVDHVLKQHEKLGTKNDVKCYLGKGPSVPWVTDPKNENFDAAAKAILAIRGVEPDLTREGCSIPGERIRMLSQYNNSPLVTLVFEEVTGKNVLLLPLGSCDDGAHSQNEKLNKVRKNKARLTD